jgi:hypothetical protein
MSSKINIEVTGSSDLIFDQKGCRSLYPVTLKSVKWDAENNTLKLTTDGGSHSTVIMNSFGGGSTSTVTMNGGSFTVRSSGGITVCHSGNATFVNGHLIEPANGSYVNDDSKVSSSAHIFEYDWTETGLLGPYTIGNVHTSGSGTVTLDIALFLQSNLTLKGSGDIIVKGSNPDTNCTISLQGSGSVKGKGSLKNVNAKLQGSGDIKGFRVTNKIDASLQGSGSIKLTRTETCSVSKNVMGSGKIKISL